jgi:DNA-binding transcriptional LysR family regulator
LSDALVECNLCKTDCRIRKLRLDTEELRSFVAVARAGSLTAAAALLHVSVPALSRRMARVEAQTRLALFRRDGATLRLTAEGEDLAARVAPLLTDLGTAVERLRRGETGERRIRLLGVAPAMRTMLPKAATRFAKDHPRIGIEVADASPEALRLAVLSGAATLGIGYGPEAKPPLAFEPLLRDALVLACPLEHRLARRRSVAWRELEGERPACLRDGDEQDGIEAAMEAAGLARLLGPRLRGSAALIGIVEAGLAPGILPRSAVPTRWRGIATPLLREPGIAQVIGIWSRTGLRGDPLVAQLQSHLRSASSPGA